MRMLLQKMTRRNSDAIHLAIPAELDQDSAHPMDREQQASTRELGAAQELVVANLAEISRLAEHVKLLEPLIAELRGPLEAELSARKRDHAELVALRASLDQCNERLSAAAETEQSLRKALAAYQAAAEALEVKRQDNERLIDESALQLDRLSNDLRAAEAKISTTEDALRETTRAATQAQEDAESFRRQLHDDIESRRELDVMVSKLTQDLLLRDEEVLNLRRRVDQAIGDAARFARAEADAQAQLAQERARVAPLQAALESAQTEIFNLTKRLEEQSDAACAGIAALHTRLETATARGARLEAMNAEHSKKLSEISAQHRHAVRRATEDAIAIDRSNERIKALEAEAAQQRAVHAALERARLTAVDRADQLGKLLNTREIALRRSEERAREAQAKLEASEAEGELARRTAEQKLTDAAAEIERLETELAIAEANLDSARSERAKSHMALLNGRPMKREAPPHLRETAT